MKLCIYEDTTYDNFYPLTYLRPVYELRCGIKLLREKIESEFVSAEIVYLMRDWLAPKFKKSYTNPVNEFERLSGDDILFVNGRYLHNADSFPMPGEDGSIAKDGLAIISLVTAKTFQGWQADSLATILERVNALKKEERNNLTVLSYFWDTISHNRESIGADFKKFYKPGIAVKLHPTSVVNGPQENMFIAESARIHPLVELDCSDGPIIIEEGTKVQGVVRIEGPTSFGKDCMVMSGAKIREGCSFGTTCRVGGEIEESIFHNYSNKYHSGFIGHAYVCEWVNIGAMVTNSDLKNDYSKVSMYVKGQLVDTGSQFMGAFIGDHTKLGIGALLNTGCVIGMMCNVLGGGAPVPKYIPSFGWFLNNRLNKAALSIQLETARVSMGRRKIALLEEEVEILKYVKELTKEERNKMVRKGTM